MKIGMKVHLGLDIFFGDSCLTLWNDVLGPDSLWEEFQSDSSMFSDVSAALKLAQWEANFGSLGRWGLEEGILYSRGHNSSRI